jgi:uncharacterized lipoprotein YajG
MKRILILAAVLFVAACAGDTGTRATASLAIACDTYATVLDQLTPHRRAGKLSAATVARVNAANDLVTPACADGSAIDPAYAVETVNSAIGLLRAVKEAL